MKHLLYSLAAAALTTSCTVYAPMQPVMPLVESQGQVEVGASVQPTGRLEATAAYSPVQHVVVTGAGTLGLKVEPNNYLKTRQAELGLGTYWNLGPRWLLSTTGGVGAAFADRRYQFIGVEQFSGNYRKVFGQVGLAHHFADASTVGLTYRLARVQFDNIVDRPLNTVPAFSLLRHEASAFYRQEVGKGFGTWYMQGTMGLSISNLKAPSHTDTFDPVKDQQWYSAGVPAPFVSLGVVWRLPQKSR
ncbi:hypothetical protein F0P96_11545 [Hymenobacter busanensis]|uniref:Uncharacterized protein n=1 Tax=Hymenobacter busanensis TaxID=2607656 RepID=A0A7L4ZXH9_9BACT|nr:hypothetical protein [Hymenobacter busanensis]KAA9332115.1 hypothetical protein F0P96_11545 [Hymenobacter busanensis]QHJ07546.1 hypothetical protein GUY19_09725 [Hymenobacter busanensis]